MDFSSFNKLIDILVLNFKAMILARVKVRKKDFCIVLAGKQQKCRDRAPLTSVVARKTGNRGHELSF